MLRPQSTPHRLLRATVAAAMATAAGTGAHLVGGGTVSTPGVLGALAGLLVPIWLMAGHERPFAVLAGVQLAGQQLVHGWLEWAAAPAAPGLAHAPLPDDVSLYGHILTASVLAAWLRVGERRVWHATRRTARALALWSRVARGLSRPSTSSSCQLLVPPVDADSARPVLVLRHILVRRGPPVCT